MCKGFQLTTQIVKKKKFRVNCYRRLHIYVVNLIYVFNMTCN